MLQSTIRDPIAVSLGAIAGALSRYYLTLWFTRFGADFPYGTFFINLTGCLVMGFFTTLALQQASAISAEVKLLVAVGFLGSYTTFSTYGLDTVRLLQGNLWLAGLYWAGSALLGVAGVRLGIILAEKLP